MGPFTRSFYILVFLAAVAWFPGLVWAQFETDTPTFTPTPKFSITGTPEISTMWIGVKEKNDSKDRTAPTPTPNVQDLDLSDASSPNMNDIAPFPSPTPSSAGKGSGGNGGGTGSGEGNENGSGMGKAPMPSPLYTAKSGKDQKKGQGPGMRELYEAGIENYKAKDFDGAIDYLKQALAVKDPKVPDYYYAEANAMLAAIYKFDRPDNALAHQYCDAALKIDPATLTAKKLRYEIDATDTETEQIYTSGMKSFEKSDYEDAIPLLSQVVGTKDPATPSFYFAEAAKTLGIIYQFKKRDREKAAEYYRLALKIEPKDEVARHNLHKLEGSN